LENECVVTFNATHYALKAERVLKKAKHDVKLIPVPRQFSSNCGLALQFNCSIKEDLLRIFEEQHVKIHGIHEME
jgi:hypothetical protein